MYNKDFEIYDSNELFHLIYNLLLFDKSTIFIARVLNIIHLKTKIKIT